MTLLKKRPCHFEAIEDTLTKSKLQALHVIRIKAGGIGTPPSLIAALWNIGILHQEHATCTKHFDVQCTFWFSFELNVTWGKLFVCNRGDTMLYHRGLPPRETWKKLGITWLHIFFNFSTLLNLLFIHDYYKTVDGAGGGLADCIHQGSQVWQIIPNIEPQISKLVTK